ncbi:MULTISPECIES: DUF305 domain-containing protein [Parvularcula]|uniref:DUF305 domain-containing protein n=1 Tax=Parvularcula dongshanensis TaxID=1173995 RepID=A0A840I5J9_9PROT|nr:MULTISPECIES: DUF305 domain-containing protein [Parvularcula]MBB4660226.1 hypothetical protein [Parvularcula dongshanensis]
MDHGDHGSDEKSIDWKSYGRLLTMVLTSTVFMYFFMYLNIYRWGDFHLSETRFFMSTLMFGTMLAIMLAFMLHMYKDRRVNIALFVASGVLWLVGLYFMRSQVTVEDQSWMKSMIPHHSIAIMVSERADITDPRARKLADEIIAAQEKEIAEMEYLIRSIREDGEATDGYPLGEAEGSTPVVRSVRAALSQPGVSSLDVGGMTPEEVARVVPSPACEFRFSEGQQALVAIGSDGQGVMKLMGNLVPLTARDASITDGATLEAPGARLAIDRLDGDAASLVFELDAGTPLRVGYDGVYVCAA